MRLANWLVASLTLLAAVGAAAQSADRLAIAGRVLQDSLDESNWRDAYYPFESAERYDLRLAPFLLDGTRLADLPEYHRKLVHALLAAGLSERGQAKVRTIMSLEAEVRAMERKSWGFGWLTQFMRDPLAYRLTLFGEPSTAVPWGFRFDGHHVSWNVTAVPGAVPSTTPLFLGAQPARVPEGMPRAGLRVLGAEEDAARTLHDSLDAEQRAIATLPYEDDRGLFVGAGRRIEPGAARGIPRSALDPEQQRALDAVIEHWLANLTDDLAAARRAEIDAAGRDAIHFAWAGAPEPNAAHYHRIQGPTFLIEFDATVDGGQHVHGIWRDFAGDFGEDLLAAHRARHHGDAP